ncbi:hypothetical protein ACJJTC_005849 [Scirpophaga incertulas]
MLQKSSKATIPIPTMEKRTSTPAKTKMDLDESRESSISLIKSSGMQFSSVLRTIAEASMINYLSLHSLDVATSISWIKHGKTILNYTKPEKKESEAILYPTIVPSNNDENCNNEHFPARITPLLNEEQLWGCFYIFPEIYSDAYSPTVRIHNQDSVPELIDGTLTVEMIRACLSYLKRTPILGDLVYIKLDLSNKLLRNIDILHQYKYLVYLDLSSNYLTELSVLSCLPYLQFLSVAHNKLHNVLNYDTPQWFLTEVHYDFNSITKIRDLSAFWSITVLNLAHNNIKKICGVERLRYLRRLDLSFNHIQCLENLNHMHLLWLDVSYNNITSYEVGPTAGLSTLLHLEYLNLNENNITSMKIFMGCTRLRELHARNNRLSVLFEVAIYMQQVRRLGVLDLRGNPICTTDRYKEVVLTTFPLLLWLDAKELDPIEQRCYKMTMCPDIYTIATRRLLRLLYIEQLSRGRVSPYTPPADNTMPPLIVLVGYESVGKGRLSSRLVEQCPSHVERGYLHTTATYHTPGHYKQVTRSKFDDMLISGEFLTYSEINGESYGLSREEASVNGGKVKIVCMDLVSGLMLTLRGLQPYLILVTMLDKGVLATKQKERMCFRNHTLHENTSLESSLGLSSLQNMLSGRILITGILNDILLTLNEDKDREEFIFESDCSLMMPSDVRHSNKKCRRDLNMFSSLTSSATPTEVCNQALESSQIGQSMLSLV